MAVPEANETRRAPRMCVLLIDDQAIVGVAVRRMLEEQPDVEFHHCADPAKAIETAVQVQPTVILQDLVMPEIDGLTLVKFFRAHPATKEVPMIVLSSKEEPIIKAKAFGLGANDYLVKLPDKLELVARVRYHSQAYINLLERKEAYRRLEESQQLLANEVAQAAKYVRSLLPEPLKGPIRAEWKFIPSMSLGGDSFGYHLLDDDHMAIYLLDVCGHGVGSALLSVSAMNALRSQALPNTDFHDPTQVLGALNDAFQMEKHDEKYFTMWYGVYRSKTRTLRYGGAGHPSALLWNGDHPKNAVLSELESQGPAIGMWPPGAPFDTSEVVLKDFARMFLFSDGVFEVPKVDGKMWTWQEYLEFMRAMPSDEPEPMDALMRHDRMLMGGIDAFNDDFSMVHFDFTAP